jgi:lipopolysaccharide transport system ATP-binding protein
MNDLAVDAQHLSKQFRIGGPQERYATLRDSLSRSVRSPLKTLRNLVRKPTYFHALDDVSFQVPRGEVVGIIGRNGAGKSTLLKVLSRILEPSGGYVDVRGRVSSLLEVGTGFHNELTGRENIYLSGAILGMKTAEIHRCFDAIVAFAEVDKFVDTPVKRYSTGMFLRLGFSVAAHLQSDILLVDEVLAVGDITFQRKCLGQLGGAAQEGRTVVFVSHNMAAVRSICRQGIVLDRGRTLCTGSIEECVEAYYRSIGALGDANGESSESDSSVLGAIALNGKMGGTVQQSEPFELSTRVRVEDPQVGFTIYCRIDDMYGRPICRLREERSRLPGTESGPRVERITVAFPSLWLSPGLYAVDFVMDFHGEYRGEQRVTSDKFPLDVVGDHGYSDSEMRAAPVLQPAARWSIQPHLEVG